METYKCTGILLACLYCATSFPVRKEIRVEVVTQQTLRPGDNDFIKSNKTYTLENRANYDVTTTKECNSLECIEDNNGKSSNNRADKIESDEESSNNTVVSKCDDHTVKEATEKTNDGSFGTESVDKEISGIFISSTAHPASELNNSSTLLINSDDNDSSTTSTDNYINPSTNPDDSMSSVEKTDPHNTLSDACPPSGCPPSYYPPSSHWPPSNCPPSGCPPSSYPPSGSPPSYYPPSSHWPPSNCPPSGCPPSNYPPPDCLPPFCPPDNTSNSGQSSSSDSSSSDDSNSSESSDSSSDGGRQ